MKHKYVIALLQLHGCGKVTTYKLVSYANSNNLEISSSNDIQNLLDECKKHKVVTKINDYTISDINQAIVSANEIIEKSQGSGIGIVSYFDKDYPQRLKDLKTEKGSFSSPMILYYKGDITKANLPSVAIIGTREPTKEGITAGEYFGSYFASEGFNVVSGLAIGCDTAGHKGALSNNGITTAFLAHGLDSIYPPENKTLAEEIIKKGGILISEYPIGKSLSRNQLIERDRLQSGLSQFTIVIQTGIQGGTMHAANSTLTSNKPLYVVEYKSEEIMNHEKVRGNIYLISKGAKFLNTTNVRSIIQKIIGDKTPTKKNLTLFD